MADQLANVKGFFVGRVLAGFGAREYLGLDRCPQHVKVMHNWVVPALYRAIREHDPVWDPDAEIRAGHWVIDGPQYSLSPAHGTAAVAWFVELMEFTRAFNAFVDTGADWYDVLFNDSVQNGCFLSGLTAALKLDDPTWRG
jgi:hypothetical protein